MSRHPLKLAPKIAYTLEDVRDLLSRRGFIPGGFCASTGDTMFEEFDDWEYQDGYGLRSLYDPGSRCLLQICGKPLMLVQITDNTPEFPSRMGSGASNFYVNFLVDNKSLWTLGFSVTQQGIENFCKTFFPVDIKDFIDQFGLEVTEEDS